MKPPVRLCCGQPHLGPVCPDGKVMCCLCFERVAQDELHVTPSGQREDVCKKCAGQECQRRNPNEIMEELIQVLASGGREVLIEYTGDRLLQATVCAVEGANRRVLVRREGTTAALALRDCAIMLVNEGAKLRTQGGCGCLPCEGN